MMDSKKKKNLEETYERIINVGLCIVPYEDLSDLTAPELMLFGTTKDEKIFSFSDLDAMFKSQYEQMVGFVPSLDRKRLFTRISNDGNNAFITEEVILTISSPEAVNTIFIRCSCVMEYIQSQWKLTHWHASTPVDTENDHWHVEEWKREKEKLQQLVDQQTADLHDKNKELEIEAAIERVRAVAMGMTKPEDMLKVCRIISDQLQHFGVEHIRNVQTVIINEDKGTYHNYQYFTPYDKESVEISKCDETPVVHKMVTRMLESADAFFTTKLTGEELATFRTYRKQENQFPDPLLDDIESIDGHFFSIGPGGLGITLYRPLNVEGLEIFKRFHNVFSLAYRRFRDIEKAEAQAREAEIQLALERVRARSMAMHKSEELLVVITVVSEQLQQLNFRFNHVSFANNEIDSVYKFWVAVPGMNPMRFNIPFLDIPMFVNLKNAQRKGTEFYTDILTKDENRQWHEHLLEHGGSAVFSQEMNEFIMSRGIARSIAINLNITLILANYASVPYTEEENQIIARFGRVFEQSYTRFLDLQKAEEQTREAKIETALEKVRSRTMGMQSSDDLPVVANLLFLEVQGLGIPAWSCGYCILLEDRKSSTCIMSSEGTLQKPFDLPHSGEVSFDEWNDFVHSDETFLTQELRGKAIESHYGFMKSLPQLTPIFKEIEEAGLSLPEYQINHLCKFSHGFMLFITYEPVPDSHDIFKRFTKVFNQTYTRFLDLKKAEAQARESQIELSLERIRSQVAAMQESSDLLDIVVTMRTEFVKLGHEAHYFWHMRWLPDTYKKAMTSSDGSRIGMVMNLPRHIHGDIQTVAEWEKSDEPTYILAMDVETAVDYVDKMITLGDFEIVDPQAPTLDDIRHIGGLTFIMARTTHGEIGYSLPGVVPDPQKNAVDTLVRFAVVFDLAYKRFEDLKSAERQALLIREERDRLEIALNQLEATKDQLVQQEKLASLGQLTAGIAHEIKNPLNFVNNFSEVSLELVEEAREEVLRAIAIPATAKSEKAKVKSTLPSPPGRGTGGEGEQDEEPNLIIEILNDIEANLRKIHEHGSRADGIVKSMLQHSRGGDGKLEPTQLNPLIKEYVNLAFHGMRAGKEPINVDIELQLDEKVGEVPLIAEDFSRVILNLCNNAFDAMGEKLSAVSEQPSTSYHPKLTVRTKSNGKTVAIEIEDNGPGISDELKDKILQPFFTTKKGTQGTGLGLSITHDIIKAHGGELNFKSNSEVSTCFIIKLPRT